MKRLVSGASFIRMLVFVVGVLFLFSCDLEEDNMIEKVVWNIGEPDEIYHGGYGVNEYYYYYYDNAELNIVYVFMKSSPGCGSSGNWYIAQTYVGSLNFGRELYTPPTIKHAPVKTAAPGTAIPITAVIYDDDYVKDAILYYKVAGQPDSTADSTEVVMYPSLTDSSYTATIEADAVTTAGVEYFIMAYDDEHKSRLPELRGYFTITVSAGDSMTYGKTETNKIVVPNYTPTVREKTGIPL